jgi:hypothetical protein
MKTTMIIIDSIDPFSEVLNQIVTCALLKNKKKKIITQITHQRLQLKEHRNRKTKTKQIKDYIVFIFCHIAIKTLSL